MEIKFWINIFAIIGVVNIIGTILSIYLIIVVGMRVGELFEKIRHINNSIKNMVEASHRIEKYCDAVNQRTKARLVNSNRTDKTEIVQPAQYLQRRNYAPYNNRRNNYGGQRMPMSFKDYDRNNRNNYIRGYQTGQYNNRKNNGNRNYDENENIESVISLSKSNTGYSQNVDKEIESRKEIIDDNDFPVEEKFVSNYNNHSEDEDVYDYEGAFPDD